MNLTNLEFAILDAIANSEYGDELHSAIWTFSVWDNIERSACKTQRSLSGGISSLNKKGLVVSSDMNTEDACVNMTIAGVRVYIETCIKRNVIIKKSLSEDAAIEIFGADVVNTGPISFFRQSDKSHYVYHKLFGGVVHTTRWVNEPMPVETVAAPALTSTGIPAKKAVSPKVLAALAKARAARKPAKHK